MNKNELLESLLKNNIQYRIYKHNALFTVEDSKKMRGKIKGAHTKNLFFKNKKDQFFLFSCLESTKVDLKKLQKSLNIGNISFAKEKYLNSLLNVKPGAVTPFGLINDLDCEIEFFLDYKIIEFKEVNFHPMENTSTITIKTKQFIEFIQKNNKLVNIYNFDNYTLINE